MPSKTFLRSVAVGSFPSSLKELVIGFLADPSACKRLGAPRVCVNDNSGGTSSMSGLPPEN